MDNLFDMQTVSYCAAVLTSMAFLPQAIKVIKSQDTHALSLSMYSAFTLGVALWLSYGVYLQDGALILANTVTLSFSAIILFIKLRNHLSGKDKVKPYEQ